MRSDSRQNPVTLSTIKTHDPKSAKFFLAGVTAVLDRAFLFSHVTTMTTHFTTRLPTRSRSGKAIALPLPTEFDHTKFLAVKDSWEPRSPALPTTRRISQIAIGTEPEACSQGAVNSDRDVPGQGSRLAIAKTHKQSEQRLKVTTRRSMNLSIWRALTLNSRRLTGLAL